jgi:magnesium-transporting ATPase (P-type)
MNCEEFKILIPDYLTGDLNSTQEEFLKNHISSCSSCRHELENIGEMWTKLGVLPEEQPSKKLRNRFYSMLKETKENLQPQNSPRMGKRFFASLWKTLSIPKPAFQLGFSGAILLLGFMAGYVFTSPKTMEKEILTLKREIQDIRETAAISMLKHDSTFDRLNGVTWSSNIKNPDEHLLKILLDTLNHDPSTNVRLAAVDALYLFSDNPLVKNGLVQSLSLQTAPIVQTALINLLVEIREKKAVQALRKLIEKKITDPEVKDFAKTSLQELINGSGKNQKKKHHAL